MSFSVFHTQGPKSGTRYELDLNSRSLIVEILNRRILIKIEEIFKYVFRVVPYKKDLNRSPPRSGPHRRFDRRATVFLVRQHVSDTMSRQFRTGWVRSHPCCFNFERYHRAG